MNTEHNSVNEYERELTLTEYTDTQIQKPGHVFTLIDVSLGELNVRMYAFMWVYTVWVSVSNGFHVYSYRLTMTKEALHGVVYKFSSQQMKKDKIERNEKQNQQNHNSHNDKLYNQQAPSVLHCLQRTCIFKLPNNLVSINKSYRRRWLGSRSLNRGATTAKCPSLWMECFFLSLYER